MYEIHHNFAWSLLVICMPGGPVLSSGQCKFRLPIHRCWEQFRPVCLSGADF